MRVKEILEILEIKRGRKLDLTKHRDKWSFFKAIDRELEKRDTIISNIKNVLNGESTYDETTYKTIVDSRKK